MDLELREEVTQEALLTLHRYFRKADSDHLAQLSEDEFGGWLYACCRRHLKWAFHRWLRSRGVASPSVVEWIAAQPDGLSEAEYRQAACAVAAVASRFEVPLRGVMEDYLNGVARWESAAKRGLSENWVSQLRREGAGRIVVALREHLASVLP